MTEDREAREAAIAFGETTLQRTIIGAALALYLDKLRETHVIVPREPTEAMICAGIAERHGQPVPEAWSLATVNIYRAMLAAHEGERK